MCFFLHHKETFKLHRNFTLSIYWPFFYVYFTSDCSVIQQKDVKSWFAEINVNMEKIQEISKTILGLYELWRTYDEKKEIQDLLSKMPKPRPPPQQQQQQPTQQNQQTQNQTQQ